MGSKGELWSKEEVPVAVPFWEEGRLGVTQVPSGCRFYSFVSICHWTYVLRMPSFQHQFVNVSHLGS